MVSNRESTTDLQEVKYTVVGVVVVVVMVLVVLAVTAVVAVMVVVVQPLLIQAVCYVGRATSREYGSRVKDVTFFRH
jgi:uncharacterized membrane protein